MECRAVKDGLVGTSYIHAGEVFEAAKCPSWAEPVTKAKASPVKSGGGKASSENKGE